MQLLTINGIHGSWQRCSTCGHLNNPIILARMNGAVRSEFFCFRCYHILAAVRMAALNQKGGA